MKFFIAKDDHENILDVFFGLREAKNAVKASESNGSVEMVEIEVTGENIRRLLANTGGYAKSSCVYTNLQKL